MLKTLLIKAARQFGLFDKIVPVSGGVRKDGATVSPHYARRKVRAAPTRPAEQTDLLDGGATRRPERKPETARASAALGDLFDGPGRPRVTADAGAFDPAQAPRFGVVAGVSKETRRRINAEAVALIEEKSSFTAQERALLAQYSGRGGCGDSLNEFYTDPKVAAAMWYGLRGMGLPSSAAVLEPSCATGVFLETAPAGVKVTGVELDPTSAKIGMALHPAHDVENASLESFAVTDTRLFDAVIGNAPFGLRGSLIKDDKKDLKTAEAYFLDTALDKTKAGGIVAMIVPTGVLDGKNTRALRERLLRKAEFIGALRMPNTAFEHSHTGVTSDIVYFRKRPDDTAGALSTVSRDALRKLGVWDEEYLGGRYFTGAGAANVLGTLTAGWRAKAGIGDDITVEGTMHGVPEAIAGFRPIGGGRSPDMASILSVIGEDADARAKAVTAALRRPYDGAKPGDTKIIDGVEYVLQGRPPRWHRVDEFLQDAAVVDAVAVASDIDRVLRERDQGMADTAIQRTLSERVRAYVEKHGVPAENANLLVAAGRDKVLYRLIGAVKPDGTLSDVVENRVSKPTESSFEAAALSLALEVGDFTPEQVAARWHAGDSESALDHLHASPDYALNPGGSWTSLDNYLSGELWPKLDEARAALDGAELKPEDRAKLERQARLLEETIDPKSLEDVEVMLNSAFVPTNIVAAYFNHLREETIASGAEWARNQAPMSIRFNKGIYTISGGLHGHQLLDNYLNRTGVRKDDLPTIDRWNEEFKTWLCGSEYRDQVEDLYNRKFLGYRQRAYSEKPFEVPGLNSEGLKTYQYAGLRWALEAGKGIIAADVGLGKTARGLMLARMLKVTGKAARPIITVPKSVLAKWYDEAERWFPGSRVLVIGESYTRDRDGNLKARQDTADERNRKFHDLTQNDYDFILISQPAWNDLDVDPITKGQYANDDFWVQRGDALGNAGDKRLNKIREAHAQAIAQRDFQKRTDAIYFNDLGIDAIIGDEFHAYKNLYAARNRFGESPKFLGGQGLSNRALDMSFKARWVREKTGGRNVYGLTATPTKNSPLEVYSMLSYIAPEAFERIGVRNSEEFLDRFCEFETQNILSTSGQIEEALVTVGFKNLDELREIMRRYIDRKTAEDVGLQLPVRDDRMHLIEMSGEQKAVYATLRRQAEEAARGGDATGDAHIFSIMSRMGKAALDLEVYDPIKYAGAISPKYEEAAREIVSGLADGGQVVFCESLPAHDKLAMALVDSGVPREQIGIFNAQAAASSAQRQNLSDAFNKGKIKVVIGNATMSEGVDLQKVTTDIHHLDLPWEPASMQQRNGRGLRQGNINEAVRIHTYMSKGSFDGYRYQSLLAKRNWQDLLWNGGNRIENLAREGAVSRDEMMIMLAADPEAARAQHEANKAAASERHSSAQRGAAASNFLRFQEMKASYRALKDKKTSAAARLAVQIERARNHLASDHFFTAKAALDADEAVIVHPQTGAAYAKGVAFELAADTHGQIKEGGRFVVQGVDPKSGIVAARRYGDLGGLPLMLKAPDLAKGVQVIAHDAAAEEEEFARKLAEAAASKAQSLKHMNDVRALPEAAIEANYQAIQSQIKTGMKGHKFSHEYGPIGYIHPRGHGVASESYERLEDDHDLMLPIERHKEKAIEAFLADEKSREYKYDYAQARRGGKTTKRFVVNYPGKFGQTTNRWESIGRSLFGHGFSSEVRARLAKEQNELARRAPTFTEALTMLAPTAAIGYSGRTIWPRKALTILWAKAKQSGVLNQRLDGLIPKKEAPFGGPKASLPAEMFQVGPDHYRQDYVGQPIKAALVALAKDGGHADLAAAMIISEGGSPEEAMLQLAGLPLKNRGVIEAMNHLIEKNPALGDKMASDMVRYNPDRPPGGDTTMRELVARLRGEGGYDERSAA